MKILQKFCALLAASLALAACATTHSKNDLLVGRWKSHTEPSDSKYSTSYYVIDRYANGRYAKKWFAAFDFNKPAEVFIEWGHWKLKGNHYWTLAEGCTTDNPFFTRDLGKWQSDKILSIAEDHFDLPFHDTEVFFRREVRIHDKTPLRALKMPRDPSDKNNGISSTQLIVTPLDKVPSWIP